MAEGGRYDGSRLDDGDGRRSHSQVRNVKGSRALLLSLMALSLVLVLLVAFKALAEGASIAEEQGGARMVGALGSTTSEQWGGGAEAAEAAPRPARNEDGRCAKEDLGSACSALVRIAELNGLRSWTKSTGWLQGQSLCTWHGIVCNEESGDIIELDLGSNGLTGPLPVAALAELTTLRQLSLDNNDLSGTWDAASDGKQLVLPELIRLNIGYNKHLTGPVPDLAALLPKLEFLFLNYCRFEGPVTWLQRLPRLRSVYLCGNRGFSGEVPDMHELTDLEFLDIGRNRFGGDCPSFAGLRRIKYIDISRNELSGTVPPMGGHPALQYLLLNHNALTGSLPSLNECPDLHSIDVSHNKLSGELPSFTLPQLAFLDASHNKLSGTIQYAVRDPPTALFGAPKLAFIVLSYNRFGGVFPQMPEGSLLPPMTALRGLALSHNNFAGADAKICESMPHIFQLAAAPRKKPCALAGNAQLEADCAKVPACIRENCGVCNAAPAQAAIDADHTDNQQSL